MKVELEKRKGQNPALLMQTKQNRMEQNQQTSLKERQENLRVRVLSDLLSALTWTFPVHHAAEVEQTLWYVERTKEDAVAH